MDFSMLVNTSCYLDYLKNKTDLKKRKYCASTLCNFNEINEAKYLLSLKKMKMTICSFNNKDSSLFCPNKIKKTDSVSVNQRKFERLILIKHAANCNSNECSIKDCSYAKFLIGHCKFCHNKDCTIPFCQTTKLIVNHYGKCIDKCQVCKSVTNYPTY